MKRLAVVLLVLAAILPLGAQNQATGAQHGVFYTWPAMSATGSTPWIWVGGVIPSKHAIEVTTTGSPTYAGNLEGSLDGVNATTIVAASTTAGTVVWEATGAKPVLWVRFTLTSLSGGTATPIYAGSR